MILLANKPLGISSAAFAAKIGREHGVKLGFSGTLDPFARGALLLACKKHARLFRFMQTAPKVYAATIWLGATSPSLDDENLCVGAAPAVSEADFRAVLAELQGEICYTPPDFCAKKVAGVRAYELARRGEKPALSECKMRVESEFVALCGPFASFLLRASKGAYVRSYAQLVCERLGVCGTLASLRREREGDYARFGRYDAWEAVALPQARYLGDARDLWLGKKLSAAQLQVVCERANAAAPDCVKVDLGERFSVLRILPGGAVKYELNLVEK